MSIDERYYLPIRILHDFTERIEKLDIPYMLSGSTAMMYYSVFRFTADIDIVLEIEEESRITLVAALEPDYYVPHQAMRRAISDKKMFNVIHQKTAYKVDCVLRKPTEFQMSAFERRSAVDFYGKQIWIIQLEDLIISKLWWARDSHSEMQLRDVKNLMKTGYNAEYVDNWVGKLKIEELYLKCKEEIHE